MSGTVPARSTIFLLKVALAYAGGVVAWLPLLSLLLPIHTAAIAGEARLGVFTATVIAGALAASGSNILFGWLTDRSVARGRGRRPWLRGGLIALAVSYVFLAAAATPFALIGAVVAFQIATNAVIAPLLAIIADEVPDAQKGLAGGLFAIGNPLATAFGAMLLASAVAPTIRFAAVPLATALCILPLLRAPTVVLAQAADQPATRRGFVLATMARALLQIAGSALSLYLLFYFDSIAPGVSPASVGAVLTAASVLSLPLALAAGRLSDRSGRRRPALVAAAALTAVGLVGMALARDWAGGAAAFAVTSVASSVFLALNAGFAMQLLPNPRHRGRDLGLLNLSNTLPALIGPLLTWWLATPQDFTQVMLVLAGLAAVAGALTMAMPARR